MDTVKLLSCVQVEDPTLLTGDDKFFKFTSKHTLLDVSGTEYTPEIFISREAFSDFPNATVPPACPDMILAGVGTMMNRAYFVKVTHPPPILGDF